jgi:fucose permease
MNWFLLIVVYASLFAYGLIDNSRGPLFPEILKTYALNDSIGSSFFFVASLAALATNLISRWWLNAFSQLRSFIAFTWIQAVSLIVMGFAPNFAVLVFGSAIFGVSAGGTGVLVNLLVGSAVPAHLRRRAFAGLHCMYGISSLAAPLAVTLWLRGQMPWMWFFLALALGPIAVALASRKDRAQDRASVGRSHESGAARELSGDRVGQSNRTSWRRSLLLATTLALYVVAEVGLSSRLALHARRDLSFDVAQANRLVAGFFFGLFVGRLVFAAVTIHISHFRVLVVSSVFSLAFFALGLVVHPLFLAFVGLAMAPFYPVFVALIADDEPASAGAILAWCLAMQGVGLASMHAILGALADQFGLEKALWLGPMALLGALIGLVIYRYFRSRRDLERTFGA